jgi:drug/metabolite transporter (DMT)-like permease
MKTIVLTALALVAFALNSLLCRVALGAGAIDAASFTSVRLTAGALMLVALRQMLRREDARPAGGWLAAALLWLYALPFSLAYLGLGAGTGALILFGTVQTTMILAALRAGERPGAWEWIGLFGALSGLVWLVLPGLQAPPLVSSLLMVTAGVAWGFYTLQGRAGGDPLAQTARNFVRAAPLALAFNLLAWNSLHVSARGALWAVLSGVLASGVGYVIWYAALRGHTATSAAIVQLAVPLLAATGGVLLLDEQVTPRLLIAAALILGGVALAQVGRPPQ